MKKIYNMLAILLTMTAAATLTSCEWMEDGAIARTLEGTWKGNMYVSSYYNGRTYTATATEITFLRDPSRYSSGDGYWVDYYSNAPWDYVANHIRWTVDNRNIRVYFVEENTEVFIYDYSLNDDRFRGWLEDGDNDVEFNLYHVSSPNWSSYNRWGYDDWYDYYYDDYGYWSRETRSATGDSIKTKPEKPVRIIGKK